MTFYTNNFLPRLLDEHGHVKSDALSAMRGQSFDECNDLWIDHDGKAIHPRNGKPVSIERLGILGACCDALMQWERTSNGDRAFRHRYADDPTELGFA